MKGKLAILILLVLGILSDDVKSDSYTLTIKTEGLENSEGIMVFALYNKTGSIPDQKFKKFYRKERANIISNTSEFTFKNVPKGVYAVVVLHDENNNGKIDTKFMLPLPSEGVGFSNFDDFGLSNKPNFKKASFNLN